MNEPITVIEAGRKGGKARAANQTAEVRKAQSRKATAARKNLYTPEMLATMRVAKSAGATIRQIRALIEEMFQRTVSDGGVRRALRNAN